MRDGNKKFTVSIAHFQALAPAERKIRPQADFSLGYGVVGGAAMFVGGPPGSSVVGGVDGAPEGPGVGGGVEGVAGGGVGAPGCSGGSGTNDLVNGRSPGSAPPSGRC